MANPFLIRKITGEKSKNILCPNCGAKMLPRPYTYYYVIPVNKCLSCQKIWFDTDEMEILQFIIEEKLKSPSTPSMDDLDDRFLP